MSGITQGIRTFRQAAGERWRTAPRAVRWSVLAAVIIFFYALPNKEFYQYLGPIPTTESNFGQVLFTISIYVLLAVGLNVVVGFAGLLDLGYFGFFAVGAYTVAVLTSPSSDIKTLWPWLAVVPIAIALTAISGVALGTPTLRLRGDYLAIVTLGFAEMIRIAATSSSFLKGQRGFNQIPHPPGEYADGRPIFGVLDARPYYWLVLTLILLVVFGVRNLTRSRVGRAWVSIREDEDAAQLMGVPTFTFKLWAFAIGAAIGGLAGALFAGKQNFVNSQSFELLNSIIILAAVILGGSGNIVGAIVGGGLVAYLIERFRGIEVLGVELYEFRFLAFGVILIIMMIFRPQGLIPNRRRAAELKDRRKEVTVGG
ncbi:branched-chain amino acid ABC transporter permease [Micromonospora sp. HM5-17]|jgi:branched-chain amino acid transport system permease protein|uniref:branched-chain amino acid ABC transporter permease n=1 Tax=Micromonospora sp. HM5-17 TaxID=2487710 RepID=UPI000F46C180|nr:branched-chain amino acid ABC transporter permease [Micromonospora sp. HM5-17]ROT31110.1 branched-chain amino acid ABC transporter permease [Micromonospora sp. HM5-17]